ncbi:helix-turn-helix transcriptional regulator [Streptomyces luomodiensis]|uniref:Helix-turn-helix transcriptional regulator n=1 Tax=Streptomyces luomodiensis TaxID=3026192 RepID=A0ABY9V2P7_9ACTN|nr:helix-turn-helix transcriptional regulator [Streptomyces sp. SCA4-21]WNE96309.1 helix-turn-helix transcriptional regulator [Streptomyces sp. SCA4-21]
MVVERGGSHHGRAPPPGLPAGAPVWRNVRLTQMQLGTRAGIDNKTISPIENGRHPTSVDQIARLARALDVPSYRLFHDGP